MVKFFGCVPRTRATKKLLSDVTGGLKKGFAPELALDGTGGGYFLCDKNKKKCAIFKPADEEPFAPNNVFISIKFNISTFKMLSNLNKMAI